MYFEIAGIGCINYIDDLDIITDCVLFPFMFMYLGIILFSFSFFLLIHIYVSILIMLPGIFYWPWFEKVWISWLVYWNCTNWRFNLLIYLFSFYYLLYDFFNI